MNDHFMTSDDFANMSADNQALVLVALMAADADREYITIRVNDENVDDIDIYTMLSSEVSDYYKSGGVWTYISPNTLLKELTFDYWLSARQIYSICRIRLHDQTSRRT